MSTRGSDHPSHPTAIKNEDPEFAGGAVISRRLVWIRQLNQPVAVRQLSPKVPVFAPQSLG